MHKKCELNQTKIKGCCQSGRKVVPHDSKSDLPLGVKRNTLNRFSFGHESSLIKIYSFDGYCLCMTIIYKKTMFTVKGVKTEWVQV